MSQTINPYLTAQEGLVSTLMFMPSATKDVIGVIKPDYFSDGRLRTVYEALVSIQEHIDDSAKSLQSNDSGILDVPEDSVDMSTVVAELSTSGKLVQAGGVENIQRLLAEGAEATSSQPVTMWARVIKENWLRNSISEHIRTSAQNAADPSKSSVELIQTMTNSLTDLELSASNSNDIESTRGYADTYLSEVDERRRIYRSSEDPMKARGGIPTKFPTLDKSVGGWQPGQVITVAGGTGSGKSFFALNTSLAAANAKKSVLYFSMEMSASELMDRAVASESGVNYGALVSGNLDDAELAKIREAVTRLGDMDLRFDTTPNMDVSHIKSEAMKQRASATGLDLVVIDYVQLITPDKGTTNDRRQREMALISKSSKTMAMQLHIPVIQLAQLNTRKKREEVESGGDNTPSFNDIREAADIANDSDVVILIDRNIEAETAKKDALFIISKNRNGRSGVRFRCHDLLAYGRFEEVNREGIDFNNDPSVGPDEGEKAGNLSAGASDEDIDAFLNADTNGDNDFGDFGSDFDFDGTDEFGGV